MIMSLKKWWKRNNPFGSYWLDLKIADDVIKSLLNDHKIRKRIEELGNDYKVFDEIFKKINEHYKVTDPQWYEALMEKWEEYRKRIWQFEFDKKKEKYT